MTYNQYRPQQKNSQNQTQDKSSRKTYLLKEAQRPPLSRLAAWILNKSAGTALERAAKFITGESLLGRLSTVVIIGLVVGFFTDLTFIVVPALSTQTFFGMIVSQEALVSTLVGFGTGGVSGAVFGWISGWILQQVLDSVTAEIVSSQISFFSKTLTWALATISGMAAGKLGSFLFEEIRARIMGREAPSINIKAFFDIREVASLIKSPFKMTEKRIEKMVKKKNVAGLTSVLKNYSDQRLVLSAIEGLEEIGTEKSLLQLVNLATLKIKIKKDYVGERTFYACEIVARHGRPELVVGVVTYFALQRFTKYGVLVGTELDLRLRAVRLLGSMGIKEANWVLESAFNYGTDDKYGGEGKYEEATNAAIIKSGSAMIPFLKKKLLDNTKLVTRPYTQSDRAAILLKEIDLATIHESPIIANGLLNIAQSMISLSDSPGYWGNGYYGRLSAIEGLVLLGMHEPFLEYIKTIALDPNKSHFLSYKALGILGMINTTLARDVLKAAFDLKYLEAQKTVGYMIAVNSAMVMCGNSIIPFLKEKLSDTTLIHFRIPVSYDKVYAYKITQSERAERVMQMIDIAS